MIDSNQNSPKKSLGQNFLQDENIARKIVDSLNLEHQDTVIEIGPGYGVLTKLILPEVQHYIGVELDDHLARYLQKKFEGEPGFTLIHADFLELELFRFQSIKTPVKVAGNIPYHITSPVIFKIIEHRHHFQTMTLMVQREVARRIVARHGTKDYGILSVLSQTFSKPKSLFNVSKHVFSPKPKVESAVVQWNFTDSFDSIVDDEKSYMRMVKVIFGQRRKILRNSLKLFRTPLPENRLSENLLKSRPEDLSINELVILWQLISKQ